MDARTDTRPRPKATITDVARLSGTSMKTVSRVFNDEPFVRPATRERVLKAAAELHYHPNLAARSLARGRSSLIGLFYENPSPNYTVDIQQGALKALVSERYRLLLFPGESIDRPSGNILNVARAAGVDGIVIAPPIGDDPGTIRELLDAHLPFVRISPTVALDASPRVGIDDTAAAAEMTRYLIHLGHRRIAFIEGNPAHPSNAQRREGYRRALESEGIALDPALIEQGAYTFVDGLAAARRLFAAGPAFSAVFAANDDMAAASIMAARERGMDVPRDISIAGFDDSLISRVVWPQLTTIHQPTSDMAERAVSMLLAVLEGQPFERSVMLNHTLVPRASTAPAAD